MVLDNVSTTRKKWKQISLKEYCIYIIALEIIFMFVNLSKHTYILYTYTALFNHIKLRYLLIVMIYNLLEIYKTYFSLRYFYLELSKRKSMMIEIE